jgi:peptidoglycan/LPS O-acetylase OafA/YrhL
VPHQPPTAARLEYLDAVRGIAAIAVICYHYNLAYSLLTGHWLDGASPLHFWFDGLAAVSMFFVLSGLVLSIKHFSGPTQPTLRNLNISAFAISRICRILLPYIVILGISAYIWPWSAQGVIGAPSNSWLQKMWFQRPTIDNVFQQANLFLRTGRYTLLPQAWSLSVEIVLSMLVPLGVLAARNGAGWVIAGAVLAAETGLLQPFAVQFAIGIWLAKNYQVIIAWLEPRPIIRVIVCVVGLFLYAFRQLAVEYDWLHHGYVDWYIMGAGAAMLLMAVSSSPNLRTWLSRGIVQHVGRVSYSIYLCHFAILMTLTPRVMAVIKLPPGVLWIAGLAFTIISSVVIASLLYQIVEIPSIRLGKSLGRFVSAPSSPRSQERQEPKLGALGSLAILARKNSINSDA